MRPSWHHNKYHSISCYDKKPAGRCDMFWLTNSTYGPEDGYLEDVYLIRLYPRHFYQITRELFSTDLSDEAYHSIHIPFLLANIFPKQSVICCVAHHCRLSMFLFSSLRWRNLLISVKYQQTAWRHFNLNFDKLSYFGQQCKQ